MKMHIFAMQMFYGEMFGSVLGEKNTNWGFFRS